MDFHPVREALRIHTNYIVLTLLLISAIESRSDDSHCNYVYDHGCDSRDRVASSIQHRGAKSHRSCSVDDITDEIDFAMLLPKDRPRSSGILKVNFTLPNVECDYEVALLVNSSINNDRDCKNHVFHKTNSYDKEIHTVERTVCVLPHSNLSKENNCEKDKFSVWYEHVFTGCYALRFTVDGYKYSVRGNKYLVTDYKHTEVAEPKFRCYYEDRMDHAPSKELVTFALSISINAGTAGMILTLTPISYLEETKENACVKYSKQPLYTWEISTDEKSSALKNCSLTTVQLDSETYTIDTECNFALDVPKNASYCLKIVLVDERCHRQTIWNPPPDSSGGKPACSWLQTCTRILKNRSTIEYNGILSGRKQQINPDLVLLIPIAIAIMIIVIVVAGTMLFIHRAHFRRRPLYVNTNLRDMNVTKFGITENDRAEETDEETQKSSVNGDDESEDIILLYARGTTTFMSFMSDFREMLKIHCGCHVRDWYDAAEWDVVARIGPAAWVTDLLREKHRALWIDTPSARALLDSASRKNHSSDAKCSYERQINEGSASDFRDLALPSVLDMAKREIGPKLSLQYNKHFVMRLEGFDAKNRREDPFKDLSPHTRYLIPYHLTELCSHLSSWRPKTKRRCLKEEEARLRERLLRMRNNIS